jgi:hypothetical protein
MRLTKTNIILLAVLLAGPANQGLAQETTGTVTGTVMDPTGAAMQRAKVEVAGPALSRSLETDAAGRYTFQSLPPGTYELTVSAPGFRMLRKPGLAVQVGKTLRVDVPMEVGTLTESVVVTGEQVIVDTTQTTIATNVSQTFFDRLPKTRDFSSLIALAPGARNEPRGGGFQVDGASPGENVYTIDGMDVTNLQTGELPRQARVPTEFVQELQVKSSGFEAQYGGAMGGVINVVTRSGGNDFHGHAGLYFMTDGTNAGPRPTLRLNPADQNIAEYFHNSRDGERMLNPSFSLGGAILKDKLWFFSGYEPMLFRYDRDVTFLRNNQTANFVRNDRWDYLIGRIDAAPFSSLRLYGGYMYTPTRQVGSLPLRQGTDNPAAWWPQIGSRSPSYSVTFGGDYNATSTLLFSVRGGHNYRNFKNYGTEPRPYIFYAASSANIADVPAQWRAVSGAFTTNNRTTVRDVATRTRVNADVSYLFNAAGQHSFKAGWELNRLHNSPEASTWPYGYFRVGWNLTYPAVTKAGQTLRGKYGYLMYRYFATTGDVASNNMSIFFQDTWRPTRKLSLQLGVRTEREYLPAFRQPEGFTGHPIEFGFGEKFAPRIGAAYDLKGDGKWKLYASFGLFYDLMKYELPRGSFNGDQWKDYVYPLDDPDIGKIGWIGSPAITNNGPVPGLGTPFEVVDWRIPSDPGESIDQNLKPMRRRVYDFGLERALTDKLALYVRYTHNSLDRAIEDVGIMTDEGEHYYIANPGFGMTVDPKLWPAGYPMTVNAVRKYDAVEFRLDRRFSRNFQFNASYTISRLHGNYGGLTSSDENARFSPNVNRYFDLPFMTYDKNGREVLGRLATDRPHSFKFFGTYEHRSRAGTTGFSPAFFLQSGTPLSTEVFMVSSTPIFAEGRGDLGRTPAYTLTDALVYHEFLPGASERFRVRLEANISNLFNHATATNYNVRYTHESDGQIQMDDLVFFKGGWDYKRLMAERKPTALRQDPRYNMPSAFIGPRELRFGVKLSF